MIAKKLSISNIYSRAIIFHSLAVTYMLISFYICSWIPLIGVYIAYAPAIGFFIYGYRLYYFIYKRVLVSNATKLIKTSLLLVLFSPLIYIGIYLPILLCIIIIIPLFSGCSVEWKISEKTMEDKRREKISESIFDES